MKNPKVGRQMISVGGEGPPSSKKAERGAHCTGKERVWFSSFGNGAMAGKGTRSKSLTERKAEAGGKRQKKSCKTSMPANRPDGGGFLEGGKEKRRSRLLMG